MDGLEKPGGFPRECLNPGIDEPEPLVGNHKPGRLPPAHVVKPSSQSDTKRQVSMGLFCVCVFVQRAVDEFGPSVDVADPLGAAFDVDHQDDLFDVECNLMLLFA